MAFRKHVSLSLLALLLLSVLGPIAADLEGFDVDDEPASQQANRKASDDDDIYAAFKKEDKAAFPQKEKPVGRFSPKPLTKEQYFLEGVAVLVLVLFSLNILMGTTNNKKIADAFVKEYCGPYGIFDRNFAQLGPGNTKDYLRKESPNIFEVYASGRRYCHSMLATLNLKPRQDGLSMLWGLIEPNEDTLQVEVYMNESSMPPMSLAVATHKITRTFQREVIDLARFTKRIGVAKDQISSWPTDRLHVLAEHSFAFYDLFSDPKVHQLFNPGSVYGPNVLKYFRSLHFTSDFQGDKHKNVLRFIFKLPRAHKMHEINKLIEMVPLFIDLVGNYRLTVEQKKKALDVRASFAKVETAEQKEQKLEALEEKRQQKLKEEKERVARMAPQARQKYEEKKAKTDIKKAMSRKTVRI